MSDSIFDKLKEAIEELSESGRNTSIAIGNVHDIYKIIEGDQRAFIDTYDTATKIENLTGYTLNELLDKFAAGWTLVAPVMPDMKLNGELSKYDVCSIKEKLWEDLY